MEVPVTSATTYPVTGIATPAQHPWVVPEVSTPSTSILDCTPVLHPIETPAKLPRLVPMMSTPSSGDLDHFPIHDSSAIDTSVEEGNTQVPVTHQDPPDEEDGQVILSEGSPSTLKSKLGQAVLKAVGESDKLRQLDELHHRLKLKRKDLKQKSTSSESHQHQHILSADQSAVLRKKIDLSRMVREREREHFGTHHELPIDDDYNKLLKLLGYVKMLLRKWNILL